MDERKSTRLSCSCGSRNDWGTGGDESPSMVHGKANAASLNNEANKIVTHVPILRNGLIRAAQREADGQPGKRTNGS